MGKELGAHEASAAGDHDVPGSEAFESTFHLVL